ncbi:MAG: efflux RND transporter periplasmic adaptor subunit [Gammaproteobacteria bacterium]
MAGIRKLSRWLPAVVLLAAAAGGFFLWRHLSVDELPAGFASGNGRIEAIEVNVATKLAGRLEAVLVDEGDMVDVGQVVARMDTRTLKAQLRAAQAKVEQAQRERDYALAIVRQRKSECALAEKQLARSRAMRRRDPGSISQEQIDHDVTALETARAACAAAEAQLANVDASIEAAVAEVERIQADIEDSILKAPLGGRVLYRLAEPGEVLPAGGRVLTLLDLTDVYMTLFLPTDEAGRVSLGAEARIIFDAAPHLVIPASVSFVAPEAQFTPKEVETRSEREKLMFRIKARIDPALLRRHIEKVKTGVPGVAYVRLDPARPWPEFLRVRVPE